MTSTLDTTTTELDASVAGPVLEPGDPGYAEEVASFSLTFSAAPAVVVGATSANDVAAAVRYAARTGRRVAVQGTGHGLQSDLVGTVLVSTRRMDGVTVDPESAVARVQAAARWRQVIDAAALHGLAPLDGSSSQVGVVGYTLGGGLGPMAAPLRARRDHVRRFTIVTADGEIRDVTAESDPDLFWAVRGGKSNFGIVAELEFGLVRVARFYGGCLFFPTEATAAVLHAVARVGADTDRRRRPPRSRCCGCPGPGAPGAVRGAGSSPRLRFVHLGTAEEGAAAARADARGGHPADGPRRRDALRGRRRRAHGPDRAHACPRMRCHGGRAAGRGRRRPARGRRAGGPGAAGDGGGPAAGRRDRPRPGGAQRGRRTGRRVLRVHDRRTVRATGRGDRGGRWRRWSTPSARGRAAAC